VATPEGKNDDAGQPQAGTRHDLPPPFRLPVGAKTLELPEADLLEYARRGDGMVAVLALELLSAKDDRDHAAFEPVLAGRIDTGDGTAREHAFALRHHTARGPVLPGSAEFRALLEIQF
jgi:hypothetical protein